MPSEVKFCSGVAQDLMKIDNKACLQNVEYQTSFRGKNILSPNTFKSVSHAVFLFWSTVHTNFSDAVEKDEGWILTSQNFTALGNNLGIKLKLSGI